MEYQQVASRGLSHSMETELHEQRSQQNKTEGTYRIYHSCIIVTKFCPRIVGLDLDL